MSAYTIGHPNADLAPPGSCVFGPEFSSAPLLNKQSVSHDTRVFTFGLDGGAPLGLSTCACILARGGADAEGNPMVRPYTPVSTNALKGKFELMVKIYDGGLSKHMDGMAIGDSLDFKHIEFNVKTQYPFGLKHIGMLVGGTGIAPMLQALHAILGTEGDTTKVTVMFGNRTEADILAKETLDTWSASFGDRLTVVHVLSNEEEGSAWAGPRGFISEDLITAHMPAPADADAQIWICGPPPMYDALCGPRGEQGVAGTLGEMGYSSEQVYKF